METIGKVEGIVGVEVVSKATPQGVVGENYTGVMVAAASLTSKV